MTDAIYSDPIITPRIVREVEIHDIEALVDDMHREADMPSALATFGPHREDLARVARKMAGLVIKLQAREWMR